MYLIYYCKRLYQLRLTNYGQLQWQRVIGVVFVVLSSICTLLETFDVELSEIGRGRRIGEIIDGME